jgi:hypothetical protein
MYSFRKARQFAPQEEEATAQTPMEQYAPEEPETESPEIQEEQPNLQENALRERLGNYNQQSSPGRGVDLNDPELLKFILLKLLQAEGQQEEVPEGY